MLIFKVTLLLSLLVSVLCLVEGKERSPVEDMLGLLATQQFANKVVEIEQSWIKADVDCEVTKGDFHFFSSASRTCESCQTRCSNPKPSDLEYCYHFCRLYVAKVKADVKVDAVERKAENASQQLQELTTDVERLQRGSNLRHQDNEDATTIIVVVFIVVSVLQWLGLAAFCYVQQRHHRKLESEIRRQAGEIKQLQTLHSVATSDVVMLRGAGPIREPTTGYNSVEDLAQNDPLMQA